MTGLLILSFTPLSQMDKASFHAFRFKLNYITDAGHSTHFLSKMIT